MRALLRLLTASLSLSRTPLALLMSDTDQYFANPEAVAVWRWRHED